MLGPYLDGHLTGRRPVADVQVLHTRCKVVKAVLLLQKVPVAPPCVAVLSTTPAKEYDIS